MGKSSSSSKKIKRSKDSSKLRSVKKKKTKRSKSKKIRRIEESDSSVSDSSLYSSSDDDYRRQKRRSKVSNKKRPRKRYSSSSESDDDDDGDDDIHLLKKKKSSKRKDKRVGKKKKKKISSRKRRRRDSSSSYTSSDNSQSDDGSESDGKRRTGRLGKVEASRRRSEDLAGEDSEPDECWQVEDEVMTEKNPKRLKSIIVVSYNYGNDETKDDMVDDQDVYQTRGSNSDSGSRELRDSEESYERDGETTVSYPRNGDDGYNGFEEDNKSGTSKPSHPDNSLKDADLEAILKRRALENLKRFRGESQRTGLARKEESSSAEGVPRQTETRIVEESQDHGLIEQELCVSPPSKDFEASQKILQVVNIKESGTALADLATQQDQQSGYTANVKASSGISSCTTKRKLIRPVLGQESSNLASRKEAASCRDAEAEIINGRTIETISPQSSLALATKNGGENLEPTKNSSSPNAQSSSHADTETLETKDESQSEQKTVEGTKDESQYEQKTMTVMRGGELVQVNYKVYIPKKASSLGRRQLKR